MKPYKRLNKSRINEFSNEKNNIENSVQILRCGKGKWPKPPKKNYWKGFYN